MKSTMRDELPNMIRIITGYLASLVIATSLLTRVAYQILNAFSPQHDGPLDVLYVWAVLGFWTLVITLIPAALLIYFGERHSWRNPLLYVGSGAVLGVPVGLVFNAPITLEIAAIGAIAGLTYWAIAGRTAGLRRRQEA
jgi:hypothetical protein